MTGDDDLRVLRRRDDDTIIDDDLTLVMTGDDDLGPPSCRRRLKQPAFNDAILRPTHIVPQPKFKSPICVASILLFKTSK